MKFSDAITNRKDEEEKKEKSRKNYKSLEEAAAMPAKKMALNKPTTKGVK